MSCLWKSGSWFTYEGEQLGQGKEKVRQFLKSNPELSDELEQKIFQKLGIGKYAAKNSGEESLDVPGSDTPLSEQTGADSDTPDFDDSEE